MTNLDNRVESTENLFKISNFQCNSNFYAENIHSYILFSIKVETMSQHSLIDNIFKLVYSYAFYYFFQRFFICIFLPILKVSACFSILAQHLRTSMQSKPILISKLFHIYLNRWQLEASRVYHMFSI